jgi:EAL domain-containing protein (putative c-di-GMP-specific phosphodiesterase class I)
MGGDEFVIIFEEILLHQLTTILDRILESIGSPIHINESTIQLTGSMGVVESDSDLDYKMLLSKADSAMYESKRLGKNRWMLFSKELEAKSSMATQIFASLPKAIAENKFKLFFQTKHASKTHKVLGVEALLRWQGPSPGLMLPGEFLPYAEKAGLTGQIGTWVVDAALSQIKKWSDMGMNIPVSINISALQVRDPRFLESTLHLINQYKVDPTLITFEINESMLLDVSNEVTKVFQRLSDQGVNVSIDGFGTGCANLASLKKFPANELKIDSSFIRGLSNDEVSLNLIQALTMLGHSFGLRVVAEKIDELDLISKLENIGCDVLQGFSFSEPISAEEVTQTLIQNNSFLKVEESHIE